MVQHHIGPNSDWGMCIERMRRHISNACVSFLCIKRSRCVASVYKISILRKEALIAPAATLLHKCSSVLDPAIFSLGGQ